MGVQDCLSVPFLRVLDMPEPSLLAFLDRFIGFEESCRRRYQRLAFVCGSRFPILDEVLVRLLGFPFLVDIVGR